MVTTKNAPHDLPSVVDFFASYVEVAAGLKPGNQQLWHALANRRAHQFLRNLIEQGRIRPEARNHAFLTLTSRIFVELSGRHPDNPAWYTFCLARSNQLAAAASLVRPPTPRHSPALSAVRHYAPTRPRQRQAASRRSARQNGVGKNYRGPNRNLAKTAP